MEEEITQNSSAEPPAKPSTSWLDAPADANLSSQDSISPEKNHKQSFEFWFFKTRLWILFHVIFPLRVKFMAFVTRLKRGKEQPPIKTSEKLAHWWYLNSQSASGLAEKLEENFLKILSSSKLIPVFVSSLLFIALTFFGAFSGNFKQAFNFDWLHSSHWKKEAVYKKKPKANFALPTSHPSNEQNGTEKENQHFLKLLNQQRYCEAQKRFSSQEDSSCERKILLVALNLEMANFGKAQSILNSLDSSCSRGVSENYNSLLEEIQPLVWLANNNVEAFIKPMSAKEDCQANLLNKAACLLKISKMHDELAQIDGNKITCGTSSKNTTSKTISDFALAQRDKQLQTSKEAIKVLLLASQNTDGLAREKILNSLSTLAKESEKQESEFEHAKFLHQNKIKAFELTKVEKALL